MNESDSIKLQTGRLITVESIQQWKVYSGLLEGLPTTGMNRGIVSRVVEEEQVRTNGAAPFLVEPVEHPVQYDGTYPFGTLAALPGICCVARFHSHEACRDMAMDYSDLTVIWFQDRFAFPIDPVIAERIRTIDWNQHATEDSW